MVNYSSVKNGIALYLDRELLNKINGWHKWVVGSGLSIYMEKGVDVFNYLKSLPVIQSMGIIDQDDNIDIDLLYNHFSQQARKSAVTFKVPLVGDITLKAEDVDKLYKYIMEYTNG